MGFPLRLLAREVYDRVVAAKGAASVGLITGEERILPPEARWLMCTTESMPLQQDVAFVALDEAQLGSDPDRGHVFTDRLLNVRGREETVILGSEALGPLARALIPGIEITTRPRFSQLSYTGPKKLSRLPPRSAIIAFSADQVYAIAEQVRRTLGGAAIVMGNMSPRARNAQVALYQSGEVDYLVATDAIGMGLNLDVGHIAFAGLNKFDGTRLRRLRVEEMAQIAGRAGRHQRDGTFGTVSFQGEAPEFTEIEIERIEEHRFKRLDWLYWRNSDLDFASAGDLLDSLSLSPPRVELRPSPMADDEAVLRILSIDPEIAPRARGEAMVRLLWEACGVPDFRGTGPDFHARLIARLFVPLASGNGQIPTRMIADEVARLDNVQGDVATLVSRLAAIRTWTYAANRNNWFEDSPHWAERTRDVEHRLSDVLHARLMERFIDRRTTRLVQGGRGSLTAQDFAIGEDGLVSVLDQPVGQLDGFRFSAAPSARQGEDRRLLAEAEARLPAELAQRAAQLIDDSDGAFQITTQVGQAVAVQWRGARVAGLVKGRSLLSPQIDPDPAIKALEPRARDAVRARLARFVEAQIAARLGPLVRLTKMAFNAETLGELRAFLAPLAENGGVATRHELAAPLATLLPEHRNEARKLGLLIGTLAVYHPHLLKPQAVALRMALLAVRAGQTMPPLPMPGLGLLDRPSIELGKAARDAGYFAFGTQMLRHDLVERIARALHDQREGHKPFVPDVQLATSLGVGEETFGRVLRALGFAPMGQGRDNAPQWRWRGIGHAARAGTVREKAPRRRPRKNRPAAKVVA